MFLLLILILLLAEPAHAEGPNLGLPELTSDVLASCLEREIEIEKMDASIARAEAQITAIRRALDELSLQWRTLAPTARVDASLTVEVEALKAEHKAARERTVAIRSELQDVLVARRTTLNGYQMLCVGRTYTDETLEAAKKLLNKS